MHQSTHEDQIFDKIDFTEKSLPKGEYENCVFKDCDFSNGDLSEVFFLECKFIDCNLSMTDLTKATLRDIQFTGCKMLGLHFSTCNPFGFGIRVEGCIANYSSFYQAKLKKTFFVNSILLEVDFTESDLSNAVFDSCDLTGATFDNTIVEKADFRTSFNYSIDPERNKIKKAKFSLPGVTGLLDKYDIQIEL